MPQNFRNSAQWRITHRGLEVAGEIPRTDGPLVTVPRVWSDLGVSMRAWALHFKIPLEFIIATACTETHGHADSTIVSPSSAENRQNKSPFAQAHQVFPGHRTTVNLRVDEVLAQIAPLLARRLRLRARRLARGLGTKATSRAMKSIGSKMTCVVPSRYGVLSS